MRFIYIYCYICMYYIIDDGYTAFFGYPLVI